MLATNKSLSVLDLSRCGVTDAVAQYIGAGLTENKTLQALSIDSVHLTHEGIKCIYESLKQTEAMKILKQFGINLEIFYNPFCLVISIEQDTHAALNVFKSLERDTTVEGLVICKLPSLEKRDIFSCYLSDDNEAGELVICGLPTSDRINQKSRFHTLPASCNLSARSDDSEALGCAVERMLSVNQTMRILNLQDCHVNDMMAGHIATGLTKNNSVKQLNLSLSRITNVSMKWTQIDFLQAYNMFTSVGAAHIFESLEHNTSLEELDLSSNDFSYYQYANNEALGCAVEGMLTVNQTLRILNLQDCHLHDATAGHIATGLTKNNSVKQLNLSLSRITVVGAAHFFKSLEHNTSLEKLDLSSNDFSYYQYANNEALGCAVEGMLTVNQTLRILNLQDCHLHDATASHIATGLTKNNSLKQLSLGSNSITRVGAVYIFKSLEHNTSLEKLDLSSNSFISFYQYEALGCAVEGMLTVNQTLRILNLQNCDLNGMIAGHIATGLASNTSLKQLSLGSNSITRVGAVHIFKSLEHNTSLEELDLSSNSFISFYQYALGCAVEGMLTVNQTLRILNLQDCHLHDATASHIATGLTKNNSLKQLSLGSNSITRVGAVYIFKSLEHNTSLEKLDLSSNSFISFYQYEALGCAVEGMLTVNQTLRILNLQDCHLHGMIAGHIATGLTSNTSLKQLSLGSNSITRVGAVHIFKSLEHNTSLEELDLSSNLFFSHSQSANNGDSDNDDSKASKFFSQTAKSDDSEVLGCAVEGMLTVNHTLRFLNLQDCHLNSVVTGHIATGLQYNSVCSCNVHSSHHHPDHYIPGRMSPRPPRPLPRTLPRSRHAFTHEILPLPPLRPLPRSRHAFTHEILPLPPLRPLPRSRHAFTHEILPLPPLRPLPRSRHAFTHEILPLPPLRPLPRSRHAFTHEILPLPPPRPLPGNMPPPPSEESVHKAGKKSSSVVGLFTPQDAQNKIHVI